MHSLHQFNGTICGDDRYTPEAFDACAPHLKVVSKWGTGIDSINKDGAKKHGVMIGNTENAFSEPVADSVIYYMLHFARNILPMDQMMKAGEWKKLKGRALNDCSLGVIGCGNVGKAVIRRAAAAGMKIYGYDVIDVDPEFLKEYNVEMTTKEVLLGSSDFVSVNCQLTDSSYHLMDEAAFKLMKPTAYFINTARGPIHVSLNDPGDASGSPPQSLLLCCTGRRGAGEGSQE